MLSYGFTITVNPASPMLNQRRRGGLIFRINLPHVVAPCNVRRPDLFLWHGHLRTGRSASVRTGPAAVGGLEMR